MTKIRVVTWNLKWAKPGSDRGRACEERLREIDADIVCLTEAYQNSFKSFSGQSASSHPDTGYPIHEGRRKVVIWSRWGLANVDELGSHRLPSGRFVSATTHNQVSLNLVGVCIPWKDAHVKGGQQNRERWEDHSIYLAALTDVPQFKDSDLPTIVFGDFNQRMSGKYARKDVHEQLKQTFEAFVIPTGDLQDTDGKSAIDHIAIRGEVEVVDAGVISRFDPNRKELSDHFGTWCDLEIRER